VRELASLPTERRERITRSFQDRIEQLGIRVPREPVRHGGMLAVAGDLNAARLTNMAEGQEILCEVRSADSVGEGVAVMAWMIKGRYVASCSCSMVCPCATASAPPDNPDGSSNCWTFGVWDVREGSSDGVDLSGIKFGMEVSFPGLVTDGNWKIGVVVDESASDDQVNALTGILSGQQGGPFAEMAGMIGEFAGATKGAISYSDMAISFGDSSATYEPLRGADGNVTTMKNAVLGFAPEFEIGTTSGTINVFGHVAAASYGEAADFVYSSEGQEHFRA
jgi:hypothetical protein